MRETKVRLRKRKVPVIARITGKGGYILCNETFISSLPTSISVTFERISCFTATSSDSIKYFTSCLYTLFLLPEFISMTQSLLCSIFSLSSLSSWERDLSFNLNASSLSLQRDLRIFACEVRIPRSFASSFLVLLFFFILWYNIKG
jgi:hypothetical protein